jgi:hypothetical protein
MSNYHQSSGQERTPAQQAEKIAEKVKASIDVATRKTKHIWFGFSRPEKIIAVGALVGLVAFFLPWVSVGRESISGLKAGSQSTYAYLLPLLMVVSLALLYFTQGASESGKTLAARWQIVIGSFGATIGLIMISFISAITSLLGNLMGGGFGALLGWSSSGASVGIGVYLFVLGTLAIVVGAFKLQRLLLSE